MKNLIEIKLQEIAKYILMYELSEDIETDEIREKLLYNIGDVYSKILDLIELYNSNINKYELGNNNKVYLN
jgi:hypothetical protein